LQNWQTDNALYTTSQGESIIKAHGTRTSGDMQHRAVSFATAQFSRNYYYWLWILRKRCGAVYIVIRAKTLVE